MKKYFLIVILGVILMLGACSSETSSTGIGQFGGSEEVLEMQGFELKVPRCYDCTGGFTQGYRYLDAECEPSRGNYKITVDYGLPVTRIDPSKSFNENMMPLRARDYDATCMLYEEPLGLGADHYVCPRTEDGQRVITLGIGRISPKGHANWFEAHLTILEDDYDEGEYIETLASFASNAIDIDWSFFD